MQFPGHCGSLLPGLLPVRRNGRPSGAGSSWEYCWRASLRCPDCSRRHVAAEARLKRAREPPGNSPPTSPHNVVKSNFVAVKPGPDQIRSGGRNPPRRDIDLRLSPQNDQFWRTEADLLLGRRRGVVSGPAAVFVVNGQFGSSAHSQRRSPASRPRYCGLPFAGKWR